MNGDEYRKSLKARLRVLLSPWRAFLLAGSVAWFLALTAACVDHPGASSWLGPLSASPLVLWSTATIVTDWSHRRRENPFCKQSDER